MKHLSMIVALLVCGALYAEEAAASSSMSPGASNEAHQMGYSSREAKERRAEREQKMTERKEARQEKMQEKRKEMQEKRTERREKALERINEHLAKIDERQKELNERRAKLLEMKQRIEQAPAGSEVEYRDLMPWRDGKVKVQEAK